MSPKRSSLTLFILFSFIPSSLAITCASCIGEGKCTDTCKGDYCMLSSYMPRFGNGSLLRDRTQIKGCISGEMIANNIKSMCIGDKGDEKMCICNEDKCNFGKIKKREETEKVTCKCNTGKNCNNGECEGDLCVWSRDGRKPNQIKKGCMDLSIPLFERRLINSCMLPPMSGSLHYLPLRDLNPEDLMNTESCLCSITDCNEKKPFTLSKNEEKEVETQRCPTNVTLTVKGVKGVTKTYSAKPAFCNGEFCYKTKVIGRKDIGQLVEYESEGCATFAPNNEIDEEFSGALVKGQQCGTFNGGGVRIRTCLMTNDEEAKERLEKSSKSSKKEKEDNDYENNNSEESDEEEEEEGETIKEKGKDGRSNGKKEDEEEDKKEEEIEEEEAKEEGVKKKTAEEGGEQKDIGEGVKIVPTTKNFVFIAPTESPALDESNATMITVFVLIILCICVAGVTWKFQLHRKLMRGNYDTVAGG